jgi:hypothetical protein
MRTIIKTRDFSDQLIPTTLNFAPAELSWAAMGGPKRATINVESSEQAELWRLLELLRCPVTVLDDQGAPCWWGYVHEAEVIYNNLAIGVTLDALYNRIAVAYSRIVDPDETAGERATTAWAQDAESVTEYGMRELLYSAGSTSDAHALAAQAMLLASYRLPTPAVTQVRALGSLSGITRSVLYCRGWYDTLGWRYYEDLLTNAVDTAVQAAAIASAKGQFLSGVSQEISGGSGISTSEYRDADASALYYLEELCQMGTDNNRRMLPRVDANRTLILEEEPTSGQPAYIRSDGSLYDAFGVLLNKAQPPVGQWVRLQDVIPGSVDLNQYADPSLFFLEAATYTVASDYLALTPRGVPEASDVVRSQDG